jgi:anti-sigma factor RsiW
MNEDLLKILTEGQHDINSQKLLDYLNGKLNQEEKHEVEKAMADSEFMNDAIEGLGKMPDPARLQHYVEQLNKGLQNHLDKKRMRREKRKLKQHSWLYFAIILILALCIIGYVVIRQYLH